MTPKIAEKSYKKKHSTDRIVSFYLLLCWLLLKIVLLLISFFIRLQRLHNKHVHHIYGKYFLIKVISICTQWTHAWIWMYLFDGQSSESLSTWGMCFVNIPDEIPMYLVRCLTANYAIPQLLCVVRYIY